MYVLPPLVVEKNEPIPSVLRASKTPCNDGVKSGVEYEVKSAKALGLYSIIIVFSSMD